MHFLSLPWFSSSSMCPSFLCSNTGRSLSLCLSFPCSLRKTQRPLVFPIQRPLIFHLPCAFRSLKKTQRPLTRSLVWPPHPLSFPLMLKNTPKATLSLSISLSTHRSLDP
ncbi:hypothetical protein AMTRI_Chr01g104410 [Amborella trichopoda]